MSRTIHEIGRSAFGCALAPDGAGAILATTLDIIPVGIVLVDAGARIFHSNIVARAMLSAGEPITSRQGELRAAGNASAEALMAAVKRAVPNGHAGHHSSVPLFYRDGRAALAHVRPLPHLSAGAATAVFVTELIEPAPPPLAALMTLFGLTPSETRVLEQIAAGRNRREAASALGVADSTVKTHLEALYSKTDTSDQAGLCRLIAALSWPDPPPPNGG